MTGNNHLTVQYALAPYTTKKLGKEHFILIRIKDGSSAVLEAIWHSVIRHLTVFRGLSEHALVVIANIPSLKGEKATVEAALGQLVEKGLFKKSGDLIDDLLREHRSPPPPAVPPRIAITTCERPSSLQRLLTSLRENEKKYGNRWSYEVIDDSRSHETQRLNQSITEDSRRDLDIRYLGPKEQKAFLDRLFKTLPEAEQCRWLLERDKNETEPTYGLPMNLAMIRHAGRRVMMLDDDAVIHAAYLPSERNAPRFDRHQQAMVYIDREKATTQYQPYHQDPFASHAEVLGQSIGRVIHQLSSHRPDCTLAGENLKNLGLLKPDKSQVCYTLNGIFGDPGTNNDLWLFAHNRGALPEIAGNETFYCELKQSSRIVYRGSAWPSLYDNGWLHQVTCVGVDLSNYIAPIYPSGRGADTQLGHVLKFLYPNHYGILLPFTLEHWPDPQRPWRFDPNVFTFNPSVNSMLVNFLTSLRIPKECSPPRKMAIFAEALKEYLRNPSQNRSIRAISKVGYLKFLSGHFNLLANSLDHLEEPSSLWAEDVQGLQQEIIHQLDKPPELSREHENRLYQSLNRYAEAIPGWNKIFEYCRTQSV